MARFDGDLMETFHNKDGLTDPVVFGFHEDSEGKNWFRTFSGKISFFGDGKIEATSRMKK